jgi:hypothetical protein
MINLSQNGFNLSCGWRRTVSAIDCNQLQSLVYTMSKRPTLLARMLSTVTGRRQPVPPTPTAPPRLAPRAPLSGEAQWARLNAVIARAADQAQAIAGRQTQARDQLDAADYAFRLLLQDLRGVMPTVAGLHPSYQTA